MNSRRTSQLRSALAAREKKAAEMITRLKSEGRLMSGSEVPQARWTANQVEQSVLRPLAPILEAKGGFAQAFAECALSGQGVVLRLPNGQEFWCRVAEASY